MVSETLSEDEYCRNRSGTEKIWQYNSRRGTQQTPDKPVEGAGSKLRRTRKDSSTVTTAQDLINAADAPVNKAPSSSYVLYLYFHFISSCRSVMSFRETIFINIEDPKREQPC